MSLQDWRQIVRAVSSVEPMAGAGLRAAIPVIVAQGRVIAQAEPNTVAFEILERKTPAIQDVLALHFGAPTRFTVVPHAFAAGVLFRCSERI